MVGITPYFFYRINLRFSILGRFWNFRPYEFEIADSPIFCPSDIPFWFSFSSHILISWSTISWTMSRLSLFSYSSTAIADWLSSSSSISCGSWRRTPLASIVSHPHTFLYLLSNYPTFLSIHQNKYWTQSAFLDPPIGHTLLMLLAIPPRRYRKYQ